MVIDIWQEARVANDGNAGESWEPASSKDAAVNVGFAASLSLR